MLNDHIQSKGLKIEEENVKGSQHKMQHWFSYLQGYVKAIQHTKNNKYDPTRSSER